MPAYDQGDLASYAEVCQLLRNAERRERAAKKRLLDLAERMEREAARAGSASRQPLGEEMAAGKRQTRTNRARLEGLSGGLNLAARMFRARAADVTSYSRRRG